MKKEVKKVYKNLEKNIKKAEEKLQKLCKKYAETGENELLIDINYYSEILIEDTTDMMLIEMCCEESDE